jgi:hypothetical protein
MELIADITLYVFSAAFLSGLLITAVSGSARAVKIYLMLLTALSLFGILAGLIFSQGLLIFLIFQIITLVIIIFFFIIAGAAAGAGIYQLIHKKSPFKKLMENELIDYLPLARFSEMEGLSEDRVFLRVKSGFSEGGKYKGDLYIHKSELTDPENKKIKRELQTMQELKNKN